MSDFNESQDSYKARKQLKKILFGIGYEIQEEVPLQDVTNNMGENIWPPYRVDMLCMIEFIIELDSKQLHGTKKRRIHDEWRDKNIKSQRNLKTVRLISKDVLKQSPDETLKEIESQLKAQPS